jgi:hypothetical protein
MVSSSNIQLLLHATLPTVQPCRREENVLLMLDLVYNVNQYRLVIVNQLMLNYNLRNNHLYHKVELVFPDFRNESAIFLHNILH